LPRTEVALTQAMKIGVTCLLLVCSLSAFGEDGKIATATGPERPSALNLEHAFSLKLDWNVEPEYWERLVGNGADSTTGAVSERAAASGLTYSQFDLSSGAGAASDGTMEEADVERVLRKVERQEGLRLGQSDNVVRSPILEGLIPRPAPPDASLGQKFLNLPIVRWFVPLPMPEPPGGGKYFKWGDRTESWRDIGHSELGPGGMDNGLYRGGG